MSRDAAQEKPLLVLIDRANRAMQQHLVESAIQRGLPEAKTSFSVVFGRLPVEGARASDLAARAGITRQSMGEVIREMVDLGYLEMRPDPADRRAKLVVYTEFGLAQARAGRRHIMDLEKRFAAEFGEEEYAHARDVLERLVDLLPRIDETSQVTVR